MNNYTVAAVLTLSILTIWTVAWMTHMPTGRAR